MYSQQMDKFDTVYSACAAEFAPAFSPSSDILACGAYQARAEIPLLKAY